MNFNAFALKALLLPLALLHLSSHPPDNNIWKLSSEWNLRADGAYGLVAESSQIVDNCKANPNAFVKFPTIVLGAQIIRLDGYEVMRFGDPTFKRARSFYGAPILSCAAIKNGHNLSWELSSYTKFFARFDAYPTIQQSYPLTNFLSETLNVMASGSLLLMALFCFLIFYGKIEKRLVVALTLSVVFFAGYFLWATPEFFGLEVSIRLAHKTADVCLWLACALYMYCLHLDGLIPKKIIDAYIVNTGIGIFVILIASTGDTAQFGAALPFFMSFVTFFTAGYSVAKKIGSTQSKRRVILQFASLTACMTFSLNDIFVTNGVWSGYMLLSVGIVFAIFFFALSVNETIIFAYGERDHLRKNLQLEVTKKTDELRGKTVQLEEAMADLRAAQAELVQSAKLASLGTLSAGIAHEINNSLNFVNGSIVPLERIVNQLDPDPNAKSKKLIAIMKEGLELTFGIISSLRNYTGLNQAKSKSVAIGAVIKDVLNILNNKIPSHITIEKEGNLEIEITANIVALNQVLMNLLTNAIDAMKKPGKILIRCTVMAQNKLEISIKDTGSGIPEDLKLRIFDPFFTTKDVGKGTGLGLHIVKKEVEKLGGSINLISQIGAGTEFKILLPLHAESQAA